MRGLLENAVDEEGWAYATDFSWMQWPPKPGQGRFKRVGHPFQKSLYRPAYLSVHESVLTVELSRVSCMRMGMVSI